MACAELHDVQSVNVCKGVGHCWTNSAQATLLPGDRLHLHHGPIDLIISATGRSEAILAAYQQAAICFENLLETLAAELISLRTLLKPSQPLKFLSPIARQMYVSALQFQQYTVTPMICVAGAVADYVLNKMTSGIHLDKVMVNNGGDIAFHLAPNQMTTIGICEDLRSNKPKHHIQIDHSDAIRGVATSGWQGRSFSLGIADSVTVLAQNAAVADAAATVIANSVDLPLSNKIHRKPAAPIQTKTMSYFSTTR